MLESREWPSRWTGAQSNASKWHASWKISNVEELETLPADTNPRTSQHRSPGGERRRRRKRSMIHPDRKGKGPLVNQTIIGTVSKTKSGGKKRERHDGLDVGFPEHIEICLALNSTVEKYACLHVTIWMRIITILKMQMKRPLPFFLNKKKQKTLITLLILFCFM